MAGGRVRLQAGTIPSTPPPAGYAEIFIDLADKKAKEIDDTGLVTTLSGGGGSGTVTSVALAVPAEFTVSGSPITSSGTITIGKANESANTVYAGPTSGSPAQPAFRALVASDLPGGTGTVTSVALSLPSIFTVSGSPVTGSGTLTGSLNTEAANSFFAGPSSGSPAIPTFRAIVPSDVPTLNQNTTGTASNVTGTVAIANGGTGQTTQQAAINALAGAVTSGTYLRGNGTNDVMSAIQAGDVPTLNQNTTGTASNITATSNSTLTTLSALSLPGAQVTGNISGNAGNVTGVVAIVNGGTGQTTAAAAFNALNPMTTTGDMIYESAPGVASRLPVGTTGQTLTVVAGVPTWVSAANPTIRTVTATGNINSTDNKNFVLCNQSGNITLTMPAHSAGAVYNLKDISGTAETNQVTIARNVGTETFEGVAASYVFQTNFGELKILDDGTNYWLI